MRALIALLVLLALATVAYASETITYKYDARGRLIQVSHSGSVNNNVVTNYSYDKADNRNVVTTNGVSP
jgi:YD repeat-containing protein